MSRTSSMRESIVARESAMARGNSKVRANPLPSRSVEATSMRGSSCRLEVS